MNLICYERVLIILVGTLPQLIGFIRFGEPVPHGLSARPRVWARAQRINFYSKKKKKPLEISNICNFVFEHMFESSVVIML